MIRLRHWADSPEFPKYRVSDDGLALSQFGHLMKGERDKNGYRKYRLTDATGRSRKVFASRLVLSTFVGVPFLGAEAAHLNGINNDDRVENLAWKTHLDNEADKLRHGTAIIGEKSHLAKLTDEQAEQALRLWETGWYSLQAIGDLYGVTKQAIWATKEGRSRRNVLVRKLDNEREGSNENG